eukprot:6412173-Prymnesium_polylepis.2
MAHPAAHIGRQRGDVTPREDRDLRNGHRTRGERCTIGVKHRTGSSVTAHAVTPDAALCQPVK